MENKKVALCWATKKRHIAVDGKVLCESKSKKKSMGYSVGNGVYNTLALSGLPTHEKITHDKPYTHADGIIEFLPLNEQRFMIDEKSICVTCIKKYNRLFAKTPAP